MKIINEVENEGGKVLHFYSYCGGLPAPQHNDNPFGYKFSWSPKGVVLASRNSARFLENGKIVEIDGKDLFRNYTIEEVEGLGKFEVYPNRDSVPYKDLYGLKDALTVKRGTYRNLGWCDTFYTLNQLRFIDETPQDFVKGNTYKRITAKVLGVDENSDLKAAIKNKVKIEKIDEVIFRLEWLGLFSDEVVENADNLLDMLSNRLQEKLVYKPGEVDMLLLKHTFIVENKDGSMDKITSTLIDFGIPYGDTSMARTVSLPMAIAVKMIANGQINEVGVRIPNTKDIYEPVLMELEKLNIKMVEKRERI
jgi:saccharopine dehydrogenase-like NADP-dependent oxidoreductase